MSIKITPVCLDHIVLNVTDVERSLAFYCGALGLTPMRVEEWRAGTVGFPSVRVSDEMIIDLVNETSSGNNLDHFCLVVEPIDFDALVASGDLEIEIGPVSRWGARGRGLSVYLRDPDRNQIELRYYD
jgi:catechol 2,3-dioxygenase-like lactoylglutathione lyase family enzyme